MLLAFLLLALASVILWAYAKVVFTSAVAEAARYAANYNAQPAEVTGRARDLMGSGILAGTRNSLACTQSVQPGTGLVELDCTMQTPGLLPILNDVFPEMHAVGHSLKEVVAR